MSTLDLNTQITTLSPLQTSTDTLNDPSLNDVSFLPSTSTSSSSLVASHRTRRKSADMALHRLNRRVIKKPKKNIIFSSTNEKDIRKYYLSNKLTNYKPTNLETIFEEEPNENQSHTTDTKNCSTSSSSDKSVTTKRLHSFMGGRKLRRSISFSDGLNIPKSTIQTRRKRIKRLFGRPLKLEKISMDAFLTHLRSFGYDTMTMNTVSSTAAALCDRDPVETQSDIECSSCDTSTLDETLDITIANEV